MESVRIYPVPGCWLPGIPATEQDVAPGEAERLVATGAFTLEPPAKEEVPDAPADEEVDQ